MKLKNQEPTEAENLLFCRLGLYLVEQSEFGLTYAPVNIKQGAEEIPLQNVYGTKGIPPIVENVSSIRWEESIKFDLLSESVMLHWLMGLDGIGIIQKRMEELGFLHNGY